MLHNPLIKIDIKNYTIEFCPFRFSIVPFDKTFRFNGGGYTQGHKPFVEYTIFGILRIRRFL